LNNQFEKKETNRILYDFIKSTSELNYWENKIRNIVIKIWEEFERQRRDEYDEKAEKELY
jgi:hypothetical protein